MGKLEGLWGWNRGSTKGREGKSSGDGWRCLGFKFSLFYVISSFLSFFLEQRLQNQTGKILCDIRVEIIMLGSHESFLYLKLCNLACKSM